MGWRDRDWAKFTPDEFDAIYGGGASRPRTGGSLTSRSHPHLRSAAKIAVAAIVGTALIFGAMLLTGNVRPDGGGGGGGGGAAPVIRLAPPVVSIPAAPLDPNALRIQWRAQDLAPAAHAGRICVTPKTNDRICASYVVGERPADALTRRIEDMGLAVESSG